VKEAHFAVAFVAAALLLAGIDRGKKAEVSRTIDPVKLQTFAPPSKEVPPPSGSPTEPAAGATQAGSVRSS